MKKGLIGCSVVAVLILAIGALLIWILLFRELPILDASLSIPPDTTLGSTYVMVVTTTNTQQQAISLDSIDIDESFLEGFQIVSIEPESTNTYQYFGQRTWEFDKEVPPGDTLKINFTLKAIQNGHFSGNVDVCNPNQDWKSLFADVVVNNEPSTKTIESESELAPAP